MDYDTRDHLFRSAGVIGNVNRGQFVGGISYFFTRRSAIEIVNRLVVMVVAGFIVWFGYKNALLDLGSFRMPSLIPLTVYTGVVPISGALVMLFCVEQIANGWRNGFEGPEDDEFLAEPVE